MKNRIKNIMKKRVQSLNEFVNESVNERITVGPEKGNLKNVTSPKPNVMPAPQQPRVNVMSDTQPSRMPRKENKVEKFLDELTLLSEKYNIF